VVEIRTEKLEHRFHRHVEFPAYDQRRFHGLVEENTEDSCEGANDSPLTLAQLAQLERQQGIKFPSAYKEFLSTYGAGDFGSVTVLSPDPKSEFLIWETTARLENRERGFLGVVELDSDYYGFFIEQGVCSNDLWSVDHEFGYEIYYMEYPDFFDFLAKVALGIWDETA
jgi:hypothetical protein